MRNRALILAFALATWEARMRDGKEHRRECGRAEGLRRTVTVKGNECKPYIITWSRKRCKYVRAQGRHHHLEAQGSRRVRVRARWDRVPG